MALLHELQELIPFALIGLLPRLRISNKIRPILYRLAGIKGLHDASIYGPITIMPVGGCHNICFGQNCFVNTNLRIGASKALVSIGNNVRLSPNVTIETTSHLLNDSKKAIHKAVTIDDNVWIGANATILQGVTIGKSSVIAACSLVSHDVPPYSLVMGTPGRVVKHLKVY